MIKKYHPVFISILAAHPNEFTPGAQKACEMLADAVILLGSQTVLLKGINDNPATMKQLMHKLLKTRVRPYYLYQYQCDQVKGASHPRAQTRSDRYQIDKGLEIINNLRGHTTGCAVPSFVIDAPGGGGKILISANNICVTVDGKLFIGNYEGKIFHYHQIVSAR